MNDLVYNLPPRSEECLKPELQGLLEIEVSHLCFITLSSDNGNFSCGIGEEANEKNSVLGRNVYDTRNGNINLKNLKIVNEKSAELCQDQEKVVEKNKINLADHTSNCVQVKFVWFGERKEDAANLCISCESQQQPTLDFNLKSTKTKSHQVRKHKHRLQQSPLTIKSANNTLRYRVCTTETLFLDYLRSCRPIQIIVTSSCSSHCVAEPLGQAHLRLPQVLLKKFAFNIAKGHNFEHKTKIYALYRRDNGCQLSQSETKPFLSGAKEKSGEIQLRFKMLFAPSAAVAAASAVTLSAKHHTSNVLHDKKLTSSPLQHHHHHNCHLHHPHMVKNKAKVAEHVSIQGDKSNLLSSQSKSEDIVEAMKKLDAKLVAYLAGETDIASKLSDCEEENQANLHLENNNSTDNNGISIHLDDLSPASKLNVFKNIKGIKLEMEALTLQPEGTKCMDLIQNEIRPIFTVECQLSNELIKKVPRYDIFHIMQFESEKFQSLTQCTRFGQEAERSVKLDVDENGNADEMNLGRIYFTVWWREPGTCLNEMLGMGTLQLTDLYKASLLQQCKRIEIQRRGRHLACLYFKITLQHDMTKRESFLPKQTSCDSGDEKSPKTADKQKSSDAQSQQPDQTAQCDGTKLTAEKSSVGKASAQNNNTKLETANFDDETSKIRLLKGFVYVNEARNLDEIILQKQKFLICRRFWLDEPAAARADESNKFNYQEQFSIINDEKFLQRVDKQFLHLELWHRMSSDDGNGNSQFKVHPIGVVRIPLHQFFIAFRDAAITNHLCKGKLPVISIDAWAPIINWETGAKIGELKCLLAVGSDEQIKNLKEVRGLTLSMSTETSVDFMSEKEFHKLQPLQIATRSNASSSQSSSVDNNPTASKMKKTSDLLDMLQKVLMTPPETVPSQISCTAVPAKASSHSATECVAACSTALKPLQPPNVKLFKFTLEIQRALGLPLNPAFKPKKSGKQRNSSKRFPPNEPPNTYVTFQADEGQYQKYKSHEGMVFATSIVEKTTQPQWQQRFRLAATLDYLNNSQKRFILKVWKKSTLDMAEGRNQPTPMEDAIVGFAALDLSVFMRGLHIGGRFNIVDFNGRINGQLEIRCQPLEDIPATVSNSPVSSATHRGSANAPAPTTSVDSVIDQFEETLDLTHLNLGQAIKRKFTELEGISQRLRARLGDITGTEIPTNINMDQLDTWQPLEREMNDNDDLDEFENDLNTPVEENDMKEKEDEAKIDKGEEGKPQGNCEIDKMPSSE